MLAQTASVAEKRKHELVPTMKIQAKMATKDKSPLEVMHKDGSESSLPIMLETTSAFMLCQS